jgi:hypothetical protein
MPVFGGLLRDLEGLEIPPEVPPSSDLSWCITLVAQDLDLQGLLQTSTLHA